MIDRRTFVGSLALCPLALPGVASAATTVYRIGVLIPGSNSADLSGPDPRNPTVNGLVRALRELGYNHGEHYVVEARGGEGRSETYARLATELVDLKADVIVAAGPLLWALKQATTSIPIVMAAAPDAVEDGFAQSLARPGGNFTGMSLQLAETTGKRLALLKELVPGIAPLAVMWEGPGGRQSWQIVESAARTRGWPVQSTEVRGADDFERAFQAAHAARAGGLLVNPGGLFDRHAARITRLAIQHRLPAMYALPHFVDLGGLMSYSPDLVAIWKRAAYFVDKILKGARPGEIPVEQATEFDLLINLTTAKEIGLAIPQSFRVRVKQVVTTTPPPPEGAAKSRP